MAKQDCKTLYDFFDQLAKVEKLKQFMHQLLGHGEKNNKLDTLPPLGTISIIFATLRREASLSSRIMAVSPQVMTGDEYQEPK